LSWDRTFDDPIILPDGRELVTLRDAGRYITGLPKAKQRKPQWVLATKLLLSAAESGGHRHDGGHRDASSHRSRSTEAAAGAASEAREKIQDGTVRSLFEVRSNRFAVPSLRHRSQSLARDLHAKLFSH